jgi:NAD+ synthase (glutamine-hydrolysing)
MNIKIGIIQFDFVVGAIDRNADRILAACQSAYDEGTELMLTPELALCGYGAEDLLLRTSFIEACLVAVDRLCLALAHLTGFTLVLGHPAYVDTGVGAVDRQLYNCASVLSAGAILATYAKRRLPSYAVFDEQRYFSQGRSLCVLDLPFRTGVMKVGLLICEDAWFDQCAAESKVSGAQLLLVLNASPYHAGKGDEREMVLRRLARSVELPVIYAHSVGGQDELVFDGYSFALNADGRVAGRAHGWLEEIYIVQAQMDSPVGIPSVNTAIVLTGTIASAGDFEFNMWHALVVGVRDYVCKTGFSNVVIGLSGGIDSAVVLAIAVDALGADKVRVVMMPSPYTAEISSVDAIDMAKRLSVQCDEIAIEPLMNNFLNVLTPFFCGRASDATEENIQARIRGVVLMALSNKCGHLVLTTGNKSEMATGYCTLYGDMAGAFAVIKDVLKTQVYALARWRNEHDLYNSGKNPIPERIITRAPSAELRFDQTDQDSLPPYEILDGIIKRYVELGEDATTIISAGFDGAVVRRVIGLIRRNEYKRKQAPIGIRLSRCGFGKDWRYPICNQFKDFLE